MSSQTQVEPAFPERARTLAASGCVGTLATHSKQWPGYPFASLVPYAADSAGRPIFFLSKLAMHTKNIDQNWHASFLIAAPEGEADTLQSERVTLLGTVEQIATEFGSAIYLPRHESARAWLSFEDFSFYQLQVTAAYFIGGFGQMDWIPGDEYFRVRLPRTDR